jgi:hypothetical protein
MGVWSFRISTMLAACSLASLAASAAGSNSTSERVSASLMAHLFRSAVKRVAGADVSDQPTSAADGKSNGLLLSLGMGFGFRKSLGQDAQGEGSMRSKLVTVKRST